MTFCNADRLLLVVEHGIKRIKIDFVPESDYQDFNV